MRHVYLVTFFVVVLGVSILGLRGTKFTSAPMDVFPEWAFPGMKHQPKPYAQGTSAFFADGRSDRMPVAGAVQRGGGILRAHRAIEIAVEHVVVQQRIPVVHTVLGVYRTGAFVVARSGCPYGIPQHHSTAVPHQGGVGHVGRVYRFHLAGYAHHRARWSIGHP
jgi:hypothetical protein